MNDSQRKSLAEKAKGLSKELRDPVVNIAKPETVLSWYRRLVDKVEPKEKALREELSEMETLILRIAKENDWGYDRIADALRNLGIDASGTTVGEILKRHGAKLIPDKPKGNWKEFLNSHADVWATVFFTAKYWTLKGTVSLDVLFFINIHTKELVISGMTEHANETWMKQQAQNLTGFDGGLAKTKYLIHDSDTKYCADFRKIFNDAMYTNGRAKT